MPHNPASRQPRRLPMPDSGPAPAPVRSAAVTALPPSAWTSAACVAVAFPTLLAFNLPPSATFLNQAAAFMGWGVWALLLASSGIGPGSPWRGGLGSLLAALALLALAAGAAPLWAGFSPASIPDGQMVTTQLDERGLNECRLDLRQSGPHHDLEGVVADIARGDEP